MGASAGELETFTQLLRHLPRDAGMAFVLIQHLAPEQKSMAKHEHKLPRSFSNLVRLAHKPQY